MEASATAQYATGDELEHALLPPPLPLLPVGLDGAQRCHEEPETERSPSCQLLLLLLDDLGRTAASPFAHTVDAPTAFTILSLDETSDIDDNEYDIVALLVDLALKTKEPFTLP
eukprot:3299882-Pleurochrysis_carterae.AAC.1